MSYKKPVVNSTTNASKAKVSSGVVSPVLVVMPMITFSIGPAIVIN